MRKLVFAILLLTFVFTATAEAQSLPTDLFKQDPILNPIKLIKENQQKLKEEQRKKAEAEQLALLKATQPWLFRPDGGPNLFYACQCTKFAKMKRPDVNWSGNADVWDERARANDFRVSESPSVGTIAVFQRYMHVAIVEAVDGSKVLVSEWNYAGPCVLSHRWIDVGEAVYIW